MLGSSYAHGPVWPGAPSGWGPTCPPIVTPLAPAIIKASRVQSFHLINLNSFIGFEGLLVVNDYS